MFGWLKKWFTKDNLKEEVVDLFHPKDRMIYSYWTGKEIIKSDPMMLWKRMMSVGPELDIAIKLGNSISKDAHKGREDSLRYIRGIFNVGPFEEGGLTQLETYGLMDHFYTYCSGLKKNTRKSPILSSTSEVSMPSTDASPIIENGSDSGSIENVLNVEPPASSPEVLESEPESSTPD